MGERVQKSDVPLDPEASIILRYATVAQIKDDAAELSRLYAELSPQQREQLQVLWFGPAFSE
ncbi:hypothetical protein [Bradyrhizobium sp. F1.13.3]|uniref:hypothetical protein n=1 Tax=Bradyrhizobium sp. F1.13.3 TaxID=3156351 RepID=UPI003396FDF3